MLIKAGKVSFENTDSPNVIANPLPNHAGSKINAISKEEEFMVEKDVQKVRTPMIDVFKALTLAKIFLGKKDEEEVKGVEIKKGCFCLFHQDSVGHTIQDCPNFLGLVQRMMDAGEIEFCRKMEGKMMVVIIEESSGVPNDGRQEKRPRPLTIFYKGRNKPKVDTTPQLHATKLIVKALALFPYQSDKAVPWKYICDIKTPESLVIPVRLGNTSNEAVNDVTSIGGMTRSGHCYASGLMGVG